MFDFKNSMFVDPNVNRVEIPSTCSVIFVSDMFAEDYAGGAELTTQALLESSPFDVYKLRSKDVTLELLRKGSNKFWIFGNFTQLNLQLIPTIVGNLKYSIIEYDFKFCSYRSPEKHEAITKNVCDCDSQMNGKIISAFFYGSMGLWWMSDKQMQLTHKKFPFLAEKDNIVLSSIFSQSNIEHMTLLRNKMSSVEKNKWFILDSKSWIKGVDEAQKWCETNKKEYIRVWDLPYEKTLELLSQCEGLVYLPLGGDTCPRLVIEAKLLGCKIHMNDNVLHKDEEWFDTDDVNSISDYLLASPMLFWNGIKKMMNYKPKISGYTTTYNCVSQQYPFIQSIKSMMLFCSEICVVDAGSTDGTWELLVDLAYPDAHHKFSTKEYSEFVEDLRAIGTSPNISVLEPTKLILKTIERDWSNPRSALFDGMQKAEARSLCTQEFCWQMDSDEIVHEDDVNKILELARNTSKGVNLIALPVIEYWGGPEKVRLDITPWKWRLSRNNPDITHGIPISLRKFDENNELYAAQGTDGCDFISKSSGELIPFVSFYTQDADQCRKVALLGNEQALLEYQNWFNQVVTALPTIFHYSWYDIARKIRLYKDFWSRHWNSLYNTSLNDTSENNMMFDVPWGDVTDDMIVEKAKELSEGTGGHIFHTKWKNTTTPHLSVLRTQPNIMLSTTQVNDV